MYIKLFTKSEHTIKQEVTGRPFSFCDILRLFLMNETTFSQYSQLFAKGNSCKRTALGVSNGLSKPLRACEQYVYFSEQQQ